MNIKRALVGVLFAVAAAALLLGAAFLGLKLVSARVEPDLSYRTLDYDATVLRNGDLKITQHIDMKLKDRGRDWKQMYQRYMLHSSDLTNIDDISVKDVTNNETYVQGNFAFPDDVTNWNARYAGQWYIVDVTDLSDPQPFDPETDGLQADSSSSKKFVEIGWNIPETSSADSLKFDVSMTMHGVSTAYDDVVSFQWEPFGWENGVPIGKVTGTVTFPDGVDKKNSWAWLHTRNSSTTKRGRNGSLVFSADDIWSGDYLDVVAMFDVAKSQDVVRKTSGERKQELIDYETQREKEWRDERHDEATKRVTGWVGSALIGLAFIAGSLYLGITSFRKSQYKGDIEYCRDLPHMSPAAAARMDDVMSESFAILGSGKTKDDEKLVNRQMSATVMSLASKGAIAIYPGPAKLYNGIDLTATDAASVAGMLGSNAATARKMKKTSTIVIMPVVHDDIDSLLLSSSERAALDILLKASSRLKDAQVFDLKQMNKAFKRYSKGYRLLRDFDDACSKEFDNLIAVNSTRGLLNGLVGILGLVFAFYQGVKYGGRGEIAVTAIVCVPVVLACMFSLVYGKFDALTERGQKYGGQVVGLKRYLLDFSDFTDRGVLDMTLWGRYMVYATAFGIADKAMAQLAKAYPEVADPQWLDEHAGSSYMYMPLHSSSVMDVSTGAAIGASVAAVSSFSANYGDFGAQLSSSFADVRSTIVDAAPSSGGSSFDGGSGGSFNGGGGFDGGGGSFGGR